MATIYAIANGNWSDGSTWSTGNVPTVDDDVWLNGYEVNLPATDVYAKSINNNAVIELSIANGGFLRQTTSNVYNTIYSDINCYSYIFAPKNGKITALKIYGNIKVYSGSLFIWTNQTANTVKIWGNIDVYSGSGLGGSEAAYGVNIEINGNVNVFGGNLADYGNGVINGDVVCFNRLLWRGPDNFTINGTLTCNNLSSQTGWQRSNGVNFTMNGNIYVNGGWCFPYFTGAITINGDIICTAGGRFLYSFSPTSTMTMNGHIKYSGKNIGINFVNMSIINDDFYCISNDDTPQLPITIIYQNGGLNYPQEKDVKEGVNYGLGDEYEGVYKPNFPQESTVLKDVEYDDGNKVGTLEVIALSGATAQAENISVVNLTEQQLQRVGNCATVSTVQKCFEEFKE